VIPGESFILDCNMQGSMVGMELCETSIPCPVLFVDVRTADDFAVEHAPCTVNVPRPTLSEEGMPGVVTINNAVGFDKAAVIVVHCYTGGWAEQARGVLMEQGFTKVYNMGGWDTDRAAILEICSSCTSESTEAPATGAPDPTAATDRPGDTVVIAWDFNPFGDATITVGDTVEWQLAGTSPHTITSDATDWGWNSGSIGSGESYSRKFDVPGTYGYHCDFHPSMTGTITVVYGWEPSEGDAEPSEGEAEHEVCTEDEWTCPGDGVCIPYHYLCDGVVDCWSGADESAYTCGSDEDCNKGCPDSWPGDGVCDTTCLTDACGFDLGDCDEPSEGEAEPSEGDAEPI
jgi:plastocyanin